MNGDFTLPDWALGLLLFIALAVVVPGISSLLFSRRAKSNE